MVQIEGIPNSIPATDILAQQGRSQHAGDATVMACFCRRPGAYFNNTDDFGRVSRGLQRPESNEVAIADTAAGMAGIAAAAAGTAAAAGCPVQACPAEPAWLQDPWPADHCHPSA